MSVQIPTSVASIAQQNGFGLDDPSADAIWILSSTFIIFTMQSGFGLLESGSVTPKNEVNIMVKNAADVIFGGFTYWMFGYAFSFGEDHSNAFTGWGNFFVMTSNATELGWVYSKFFFQASFATTATTIVSGAMAERIKLEAYIIFSLLNTLVFCFPAHWVWSKTGWLNQLGMIDIAGAGPVHLVGGTTGLIATLMLKPRKGRFDKDHPTPPPMGSPTNALLGMFMLWWGWLGFNCGSTFGISGMKWKLAARSAVSTITASMSGGMIGMLMSYIILKRRFDVAYVINGILGSLVGITGFCALAEPWEGFVIGTIGAIIAVSGEIILVKFKIDDPVGVVPVHCMGGIWSVLAPGLFVRKDDFRRALALPHPESGLFYGGEWRQLGVQTCGLVALMTWTAVTSFIFLKLIDLTIGLRVSLHCEILGADIVEHGIGEIVYDKATGKVTEVNDEIDVEAQSSSSGELNTSRKLKRLTLRLCAMKALESLAEEKDKDVQDNLEQRDQNGHCVKDQEESTDGITADLDEELQRYMQLRGKRHSSAFGRRIEGYGLRRRSTLSFSNIFNLNGGVRGSSNCDTLTEVDESQFLEQTNYAYHSDEEEKHEENKARIKPCFDKKIKRFSSLRVPSKPTRSRRRKSSVKKSKFHNILNAKCDLGKNSISASLANTGNSYSSHSNIWVHNHSVNSNIDKDEEYEFNTYL